MRQIWDIEDIILSMKTLLALLLLIPFFSYCNENVITKIEVDDFWKQLKEIRETKYGIDEVWEKNIDYCSGWSERVALSKDEGFIMSNLVAYTNVCMETLSKMDEMINLENN